MKTTGDNLRRVHASAPGSLMLMGEHAVLRGYPALVCAVNRRIHVMAEPRQDKMVHISSALGYEQFPLASIPADGAMAFICTAVASCREKVPGGISIAVESEMSSTVGLGSSAAVTAATLAAIRASSGEDINSHELHQSALAVIRQVQGTGSGADAAASVFGGVLAYRADPIEIQPLVASLPLTVLYSGSKTPTPEVIGLVNAFAARERERCEGIFSSMGACTERAISALQRSQLPELGSQLQEAQMLMCELGLSTQTLADMVSALESDSGILGAKISGSGLGDCVAGLGLSLRRDWPWEKIDVAVTGEGLQVKVL